MPENRSVATVRVKHPDVEGGTMLINAVDYRRGEHEIVEEPSPAAYAAVQSQLRVAEARADRDARDVVAKGVARPTVDILKVPPTMVIEHPDVPGTRMVINVAEFDEAIHRAWTEQRDAEAERVAEYHALVAGGLSDAEARGTVWPEPGPDTNSPAAVASAIAKVDGTPVVTAPAAPPVDPAQLVADVQRMAQEASEREAAEEAAKRAADAAPRSPRGKRNTENTPAQS